MTSVCASLTPSTSLRPIDGDRRRTIAPAPDHHAPRMAADIAVLHHLAALLRVDVKLDQLEAIRALHLHAVVHVADPNTDPRRRPAQPRDPARNFEPHGPDQRDGARPDADRSTPSLSTAVRRHEVFTDVDAFRATARARRPPISPRTWTRTHVANSRPASVSRRSSPHRPPPASARRTEYIAELATHPDTIPGHPTWRSGIVLGDRPKRPKRPMGCADAGSTPTSAEAPAK